MVVIDSLTYTGRTKKYMVEGPSFLESEDEYITYGNKKIYRSAFYYDVVNQTLYMCVFTPVANPSATYYGGIWLNGSYSARYTLQRYTSNKGNLWQTGNLPNDEIFSFQKTNNISNISGNLVPIFTDYDDYLNYVTSPITSYTWQSVNSLTGKNKTIELSTLNDINDGDPKTTSDTTKFDLTNDSNVYNLVKNNL